MWAHDHVQGECFQKVEHITQETWLQEKCKWHSLQTGKKSEHAVLRKPVTGWKWKQLHMCNIYQYFNGVKQRISKRHFPVITKYVFRIVTCWRSNRMGLGKGEGCHAWLPRKIYRSRHCTSQLCSAYSAQPTKSRHLWMTGGKVWTGIQNFTLNQTLQTPLTQRSNLINTCPYFYIHTYIYMCVCIYTSSNSCIWWSAKCFRAWLFIHSWAIKTYYCSIIQCTVIIIQSWLMLFGKSVSTVLKSTAYTTQSWILNKC